MWGNKRRLLPHAADFDSERLESGRPFDTLEKDLPTMKRAAWHGSGCAARKPRMYQLGSYAMTFTANPNRGAQGHAVRSSSAPIPCVSWRDRK